MKHMVKKLTALLMASVLCLPMLAACGESENPLENSSANNEALDHESSGTSEETSAETLIQDDLPDKSFGGYNFRVLSTVMVGRELANFLMADEINGDKVNDELYKTTTEIEDRFDVDITYSSVTDSTTLRDTVLTSVNGGTDDFDIQCGNDKLTISLGTQGMFYNLYDVEQFNFEKPWYPKNIMSQLDMAGKLFTGSTYLTYNGLHWTRVLVANKDHLDNMQIPVPYESIQNGTWYLDEMRTICENASKDLDGNGKMDEKDLYGFAFCSGVAYCLQDTFGIVIYEETEDNLLVNADQERADTILEGLRVLLANKNVTFYGTGAQEFSVDIFLNNQSVITATLLGTAYDSYRGTEIRFSVLPFPKYDELQENYISTCTDAFWAIPVTSVNNMEVIGTVIEALSCQNYQRVLPLYYETAVKTRLSDSPDDAAMYDIIRDTRTIGLEYAYQIPFRNLITTLIIEKDAAFSSYYKRQQKSAQIAATELYEKIKNLHTTDTPAE